MSKSKAITDVTNHEFSLEPKRLQETRLWSIVLLCILTISPLSCCSTSVLTNLVKCNEDLIHQRQSPVEARLLLKIEIPPDADLTPWENWTESARLVPVGESGTNIFVQRFNSIEEARANFEHECKTGGAVGHWNDQSKFSYGGEEDNQYCASYAREWRYDATSLCTPSGVYESFSVFQKKDIVIAIYESTSGEIGTPTNRAIRQLTDKLSEQSK